jgi:hypothetical protein
MSRARGVHGSQRSPLNSRTAARQSPHVRTLLLQRARSASSAVISATRDSRAHDHRRSTARELLWSSQRS